MTMPVSPAQPVAPVPPIDAAAVAQAMDPGQVAAHMGSPEPNHPAVVVAERFFASVDGFVVATVIALFAYLLFRLLQAFMLHRSINKSIDGKSPHVVALIDKVNKPVELAPRGSGEIPGDDRNGLVLIAIGLAMAGFGLVQGDEQTIRVATGASFFPLFVGIALLVRRFLLKREIARELAAEQG